MVLLGVNGFIRENFIKFLEKKKILCLHNNIIELERINKSFGCRVYPFCDKKINFLEFRLLLNKNFNRLDEIVFCVDYFLHAKPIFHIEEQEWDVYFNINFNLLFSFLKNVFPLVMKSTNPSITFFINKFYTDKSNFLYQHVCINNLLITFMKEINKEFINNNFCVRFNCISLDNINLSYKKNIYPYKIYKSKFKSLYDVYNYIIKFKLNNKIIVL